MSQSTSRMRKTRSFSRRGFEGEIVTPSKQPTARGLNLSKVKRSKSPARWQSIAINRRIAISAAKQVVLPNK